MDREDSAGEHIWLRQSVRFMVGDQRRTLEIAIPVRLGASAEEIEGLLREAGAGMERLTRHLDAQVAALVSPGDAAPAPARPSPDARPAVAPAVAGADVPEPAPMPEKAETPAPLREAPVAAPTTSAPRAAAPGAAAEGRPPAAPPPEPPVAAPARASPSAATGAATSPARPAPPPPAGRPPAAPRAGASDSPGPPLTRPTFLAETRALGLTPPQVMERLGVRSLDGLNLDEALQALRRQLVRDGDPAPTSPTGAAPVAPATPPPTPPATAPDAPTQGGAFFDEEDGFDVTFTPPDDEAEEDAVDLEGGTADHADAFGQEEEMDELDLEDVPDFATPSPAPVRREAAPPAPGSRAEGNARAVRQRAHAREVLAKLRAAPTGGAPSRMQLNAYANIVVDQLDAPTAEALVLGVWGAAPQRLGTDQLNALIQWGKEDGFAEEAPAGLALVRAERAERTTSAGGEEASAQRSPRPARAQGAQGARRSDSGSGGVR